MTPEQAVAVVDGDMKAERQLHWQKLLGTGEFSPYQKEKKAPKGDAFRNAYYELLANPGDFIKNFGTHVHNIDTDIRGRDIGGAKERLDRSAAYAGMIALFTAFDFATSKPLEYIPIRKGTLSAEDVAHNGKIKAFKKLWEVMNDKYATALGNMLVEKVSGKRGYIHEVADKGADTLQTAFPKTNDLVNGATLESYIRLVSQIPIAGALVEQGTARLSGWQEKSSLHTATGKMLYMALGILIREHRVAGKMSAEELTEAAARLVI